MSPSVMSDDRKTSARNLELLFGENAKRSVEINCMGQLPGSAICNVHGISSGILGIGFGSRSCFEPQEIGRGSNMTKTEDLESLEVTSNRGLMLDRARAL